MSIALTLIHLDGQSLARYALDTPQPLRIAAMCGVKRKGWGHGRLDGYF